MSIKVKIRLTKDLPLDVQHSCMKGCEYDAEYRDTYTEDGVERLIPYRTQPVKFTADCGTLVVAFNFEYEVIESPEADDE